MNPATLIQLFGVQRWYLSMLVDDVSDKQFADQFGAVVNHPAWQVGHLAVVADKLAQLAGGKGTLDEAYIRRFDRGSIPTNRRSDYPSKTELLATLDERRAALVAAIDAMSDDDWTKPNPLPPLAQVLPDLAGCMHFLMLSHESNHLGQIATWRHAAGLPMALSKLDNHQPEMACAK